MLLTVDIGNTSTVFAAFRNGEALETYRVKTGEFTAENINPYSYNIDMAYISSVVPSVNKYIEAQIRHEFNCKVKFLDSNADTGLRICTEHPERVGADIICGAAAAYDRYKKAVIVFDLGTATTVCAVKGNGDYTGHSIYPGVRTSFKALHLAAEQLPDIEDKFDEFEVVGRNTISSMKSGVIIGAACFIDGMAERYTEELREEAEVVVTGGLSPVILPHCKGKYIYVENLLSEGLRIICNRTYNCDY